MKAVVTVKDGKPYKAYMVEDYDLKILENLSDVHIIEAKRASASQVVNELKNED